MASITRLKAGPYFSSLEGPTPGTKLPEVQRAILTVLAQRGPLPRRKVLIYARYSRSGATDKAFAALIANGLADNAGALIEITPIGREEIGPVPTLDPVVHDFSDMERGLLVVLATYGDLTKTSALMFAGYQRSGSTDKAWARLSANDWIETINSTVRITQDGVAALGPHEDALIGQGFRNHVHGTLPTAAAKFFDYLRGHPTKLETKAKVLEMCGYKRSGATDEAFALLVRRGYAVKGKNGEIGINPELFVYD